LSLSWISFARFWIKEVYTKPAATAVAGDISDGSSEGDRILSLTIFRH